jgi:hypothetical protein
MVRKMPPKSMNYVPFDSLPNGCNRYKASYYRMLYTVYDGYYWQSAYEVWFTRNGKWYMHVNYYFHKTRKGREFGYYYLYPKDEKAHWRDAEGKEEPYIHSNRRKVA